MPGLIRKLIIFAAADGLILQAHGPWDLPSLNIEYKSQKITSKLLPPFDVHNDTPHLESHGIIGEAFLSLDQIALLTNCVKDSCRLLPCHF